MSIAGDVVDEGLEREQADPYVLAQALEMEWEAEVRVVTEDRIDRLPIKIAMTTACERLDITHWRLGDFLEAVSFDPRGA